LHANDSAEVEEAEKDVNLFVNNTSEITSSQSEHALYPKLAEYLRSEFEIYSKRIDENRASNTRGPKGNK